MNTEFELIHQKLDTLAEELVIIKNCVKALNSHSPPLSVREAAAYLHLSESRVYDLVYTGQLKPLQHRKGGRILFSQELLNKYLYENKV